MEFRPGFLHYAAGPQPVDLLGREAQHAPEDLVAYAGPAWVAACRRESVSSENFMGLATMRTSPAAGCGTVDLHAAMHHLRIGEDLRRDR